MMTTAQLSQKLAQKMWGEDFARLSMTMAEDLRDAINMGLAQLAKFLPPQRRVRETAFVVDGPQVIEVTMTVGSPDFTLGTVLPIGSYQTTEDLVGRGLVVSGSPALQRLLTASQMVEPWLGASGPQSATLYGDGIPLSVRTDQVSGGVRWQSEFAAAPVPIAFRETPPDAERRNTASSLGTPTEWWLENFAGGDAQEVSLVLRLWPLPSTRGLVRVPISQLPAEVSLEDLHVTPRAMPINTLEQGFFTALVAGYLTDAPKLRGDIDITQIVRKSAEALAWFENSANPNPSGQPHRVGTPSGW